MKKLSLFKSKTFNKLEKVEFPIDPTDEEYLKEIPGNSLEEEEEVLNSIRKIEPPKPPAFLKEKAMAGYRKHYRYRILWRTIKLRVIQYKEGLLGTARGLEIALASLIVLFVLGGIIYYQYVTIQNTKQTNIIVNQQKPKENTLKNQTTTTLPKPTEEPIIENSNDNNIQHQDNDKNKRENIQNIIANSKKQTITTRNSNRKNNIEEEIAKILKGNDNNIATLSSNNRSISKENIVLSNIKNIFVSNLIDEDLRKELEKVIKTSNKLKLTNENECQGTLKWSFSQPNTIIISTPNNPLLWKKKIGKYASLKEKAEDIIYSLTGSIEESKKIQVIINISLMYLP